MGKIRQIADRFRNVPIVGQAERTLVVFMPAYGGVNNETMACLHGTLQTFDATGICERLMTVIPSTSIIANSRSQVAHQVCQEPSTIGVMMADADMKWPVGVPGFNAFSRLIARGKPIASALCTNRVRPVEIACGVFEDGMIRRLEDPAAISPENGEPFTVEWTGAAFLYITREALLQIADYHGSSEGLFEPYARMWDRPELSDLAMDLIDELQAGKIPQGVFAEGIRKLVDRGGYYSEDISFCRRAKAAGIPIWIDPSFEVQHLGFYGYTRLDWMAQKELERGLSKQAAN